MTVNILEKLETILDKCVADINTYLDISIDRENLLVFEALITSYVYWKEALGVMPSEFSTTKTQINSDLSDIWSELTTTYKLTEAKLSTVFKMVETATNMFLEQLEAFTAGVPWIPGG